METVKSVLGSDFILINVVVRKTTPMTEIDKIETKINLKTQTRDSYYDTIPESVKIVKAGCISKNLHN